MLLFLLKCTKLYSTPYPWQLIVNHFFSKFRFLWVLLPLMPLSQELATKPILFFHSQFPPCHRPNKFYLPFGLFN